MHYINNVKFAKEEQQLSGVLDLAKSERISELDDYSGEIKYSLIGMKDELNRPTLQLSIYGIISALCQNCLQKMTIELDNQSQLDHAMFSEDGSDVEDGVLAETEFDVMQLVEDEVIMLLPLAPKHEECIGLSYHDEETSPFSELKNII
jgi:uncharacterized protein